MKIIGVNNATVSQVDDTYYIGVNTVEVGTKNSIAFYEDDGQTLSSSDLIKIVDNNVHIDSSSVEVSGNLTVGNNTQLSGIITLHGLVSIIGISALFNAPITAFNKLNLKNKLNINPRTIASSKGSKNDFLGDVAIDSKYIYYCVRNFDGISDIWVRWKITDSEW